MFNMFYSNLGYRLYKCFRLTPLDVSYAIKPAELGMRMDEVSFFFDIAALPHHHVHQRTISQCAPWKMGRVQAVSHAPEPVVDDMQQVVPPKVFQKLQAVQASIDLDDEETPEPAPPRDWDRFGENITTTWAQNLIIFLII